MGDTRRRGGIWEHNDAGPGLPEVWNRYGYDGQGHPVTLVQSDRATVSLTEDGHLVFDFGGHLVTCTPDFAAPLADALAQHVPAGKAIQVAAQVAQIQMQIDEKKAELAAVAEAFPVAMSPAVGVPEATVTVP